MQIKESKNLMYTKIPLEYFEVAERVEPDKCILASFTSPNDKLELNFENGTHAFLKAKNPQGGLEIDKIEAKLENFIGKSYKEILNADF